MAVDCGDAAPSEGAPKDLKPRGHNYIRHRLFVDVFENEIFLAWLLFRSKPFKRTQNISNLVVLKLLIAGISFDRNIEIRFKQLHVYKKSFRNSINSP